MGAWRWMSEIVAVQQGYSSRCGRVVPGSGCEPTALQLQGAQSRAGGPPHTRALEEVGRKSADDVQWQWQQ